MFGIRMPWYGKLERALYPLQGVVIAALIVVALFSLYLVLRGPGWARVAWLVYLLSP